MGGVDMSYTKIFYWLSIALICSVNSALSMVYDNRFIPLFESPRILINQLQQRITTNLFVATGNNAVGTTDKQIGIPEIFGTFDLHQIAEAFPLMGLPNPLPTELQLEQFPFTVTGKIQAQGVDGLVHLKVNDYLSFGGSWMLMRLNNAQLFFENNIKCALTTPAQIDAFRREILADLGFCGPNYNRVAFGDSECYIRLGRSWEYVAKIRYVDVGARFGFLLPTGARRDINIPASVPFGGDSMWGIYGEVDGLFELKEDMKLGLLFRLNQRFPKIIDERLSVNGEPYIFGATCGAIQVKPGFTFIWSPFVVLENIRAGFGMGVQYHLTYHHRDNIIDKRTNKTIPIQLEKMIQYSKWGTDYVTIDMLYDFGKELRCRSFAPVLSFRVDIPAYFFVTEHVPQTYRVSLGLEFDF